LRVPHTGGRRHLVARAEQVLGAVEHEAHHALDHLVVLGLVIVRVLDREEATRAAHDVELDQLAVGVGGGLAQLDANAETRQVKDGSGSGDHVALLRTRRVIGSPGSRQRPDRATRGGVRDQRGQPPLARLRALGACHPVGRLPPV
jgi:hypothetical protein